MFAYPTSLVGYLFELIFYDFRPSNFQQKSAK